MPTQGVTKAGPVLGQPFLSTPKYYASQNQPAVIQRPVVADPNFSNHGGVGWAAPLASVVHRIGVAVLCSQFMDSVFPSFTQMLFNACVSGSLFTAMLFPGQIKSVECYTEKHK